MNLTITKEQIIAGLQAVQNVVSTRTTLPILSNVLLRAEKDRVEFTATDLDVTIACSVEATVKKPGTTTVPVKKLFGITRELNGSEIDIEVDDKNVTSIRCGASFYKIHGLGADEFPPLPKFKDDKKVSLPQETVKAMMRKTSFAVSSDESRYVLNGIFISLKDHKMTLVATDGRRLALVDEEVDISEKSSGEFIVPAKAVSELNRLMQDKGDVEIKFGENQASFALKDDKGFSVLLITKLIEGNYPNYRQVIPVRNEGAHSARARGIFAGAAPRRNHDQREGQFRQAHLREKQSRHHRQLARSRRGARNARGELQGQGNGHRLQPALPH